MTVETYWLVVPLAGIALTLPVWAWRAGVSLPTSSFPYFPLDTCAIHP